MIGLLVSVLQIKVEMSSIESLKFTRNDGTALIHIEKIPNDLLLSYAEYVYSK